MTHPRFQLQLFDDHDGLSKMEERVNLWLSAASDELQIVDRQVIATSRTADGTDLRGIERAVIVAIWYVAPPLAEGAISSAFD